MKNYCGWGFTNSKYLLKTIDIYRKIHAIKNIVNYLSGRVEFPLETIDYFT
jgi:hypothetical protein